MPLKLTPTTKTTPKTDPAQAQKVARDLGALEQRPFAGETSTKGPQVRDAAAQSAQNKALGQVGVGQATRGFQTFLSDKRAGAKAAVAGLGFFDTAVGKAVKKGVLGAITGIALLGGVLADNASAKASVFQRAPTERHSVLDVRALNMTQGVHRPQGQRALADAQQVVARWETEKARDPSFTVTAARAQELVLAGLLPAVPAPGEDLAKLAKEQLGGETKRLLTSLLDGTSFALDRDARALLEVVADRAHVSGDGKLKVLGDQSGEKLRLEGVPGATVEALNLSTIPTKRIMVDESFAVGTVGADGTFAGDLPMQAGDQMRVRLKLADGSTTDWVHFKAQGLGDDVRHAEVALFRLGLSDGGNGSIQVKNINASRPISEPGAVLRFVNTRTQEATDLKMNKDGSPEAGAKLPGTATDTFSVRATDGTNDTALATEIGIVKVSAGGRGSAVEPFDLPDPGLHADELDEAGKPKFDMARFRGPLFDVDGAKATDVQQGQIGDCYLPAAVAAIAHHVPGHFENMIKQRIEVDAETGVEKVWFEVTFQERTWENGRSTYKPVVQSVDADLFVRSYGGPLYGADDGKRGLEDMELWWPILEKAYADWKGDYNTIGNGGHVSKVFEDLLGVETGSMNIGGRWGASSADDVWNQIVASVDDGRPVGAGTHGHDQDALYANSGVYANHAYSILAYETAEDGTKYVQLRNPWGESEPFPGDGKNDGIFKLKLDDFMKLYSSLYYVEK